MNKRVPLAEEPITGRDAVEQYDKGARLYMLPEYMYFVRKILGRGITSGRVLDIGTGSGLLALELARCRGCDFDIVALDVSEDMISKARENTARYGLGNRIEFMVASGAALPFPDNSFDLVISYASLHHWFEPVTVFDEVARVTRQDGYAIIRDNRRVWHNPLWRSAVWLLCRFMNKRHRENWPKVIMSSYTVPEAHELVDRSKLNNCRVKSDFVFLDLCIESIKG